MQNSFFCSAPKSSIIRRSQFTRISSSSELLLKRISLRLLINSSEVLYTTKHPASNNSFAIQ